MRKPTYKNLSMALLSSKRAKEHKWPESYRSSAVGPSGDYGKRATHRGLLFRNPACHKDLASSLLVRKPSATHQRFSRKCIWLPFWDSNINQEGLQPLFNSPSKRPSTWYQQIIFRNFKTDRSGHPLYPSMRQK